MNNAKENKSIFKKANYNNFYRKTIFKNIVMATTRITITTTTNNNNKQQQQKILDYFLGGGGALLYL
jgi:hypothetical protein